jgi:excinuclease ABC subunit C
MTNQAFQEIQASIPQEPGIYKYFDREDVLIYVGKAKNLRKRVSSYFTGQKSTRKTAELVRRIDRIAFTIAGSEQDALLLENNLIKEFQPRFNIDLKDDKTYPYIVIRNEAFPRVFLTRSMIRDGSEYLGPFTSTGKVREMLSFIRQHIQIRTCKLNLSEKQIAKGKYKVCLEYHLGNCKGPCVGLQTEEDYREGLQRLRGILKGNLSPVMQHYKAEMKRHVESLAFEQAEILRKKIEHLKSYTAGSAVVNPKLGDLDVFSFADGQDMAFVNLLMVRNGFIVDTHSIEIRKKIEEPDAEVLSLAVRHLRETFRSDAREIILPFAIEFPGEGVIMTIPKSGDKRKLLDMSIRNVEYFQREWKRKKTLQLEAKAEDEDRLLDRLQADLSLPYRPEHIECFDNSNFQGSFPVSAMVCFRQGKSSKADYRHYNVKSVKGINDFATMEEVVFRRYSKLLELGEPLPQLVIIDGGKGQLGAAMESIRKLGLAGKMTVVGLAKQEEELFFPGDSESLKLPWDSSSLLLVRRIRDEVHRFGITFHRKQRSKGTFRNQLEDIDGIGKQTAETLLKTFKSVKRVSEAGLEALEAVLGPGKASIVFRHFHPEGMNSPEN